MPFIEADNAPLHYRVEGLAGAPVLVLSHSLGTTLAMWDPQMPVLAERFRVVRYDSRGHGESVVTPGPYTIERLGRDVIALLDGLGMQRAHFCGLSMGGMVGMWLGAHGSERVEKLVLCNTAARIGRPEFWNTRIENIRKTGIEPIASAVLGRWFTPAFHERTPDIVEGMRRTLVGTPPPADGRFLAERIPGARCVELASAHLSNIEAAERFTTELVGFLSE